MTSRELVKKTLEFSSPGRVPRHLWLLPWATENYPDEVDAIRSEFPDDIVFCPAFCREELRTVGERYKPGRFVDEWGCVSENRQSGIRGEVKDPPVKDWSEIDKVRIPIERLTVDIRKVNEFCRQTDKFVIPERFPRPFERLQFVRGTERLYIDLMDQPKALFSFLNKIQSFYLRELELWARTDVDGLYFMDDWGSQSSLLIPPSIWRNVFKPLYKEYIDLAHSYGKYIFMHSDGYILEIIPDLIELGLDALNSQIFCMGLDKLSAFAGQITFWGEIDRQYLLSRASREEVALSVRKVKEALYRDGGVIAQCEFGPGAKPDNVRTVFATWDELDGQRWGADSLGRASV